MSCYQELYFFNQYVLSVPCESTIVVVWCVEADITFLDVKIE